MGAEKNNRSRSPRWTVWAVAVLAAAVARAQDGADEQDGAELGVAAPCLNQPTIRRTRIINDRNIAFFTRDGKIYINELARECPSLRPRSVVNYSVANGRICQGTQFQVMWEASTNNFIPAFVCTLGAFVPITQAQLEGLEALTAAKPRENRRRRARDAVTTEEVEPPPPAP